MTDSESLSDSFIVTVANTPSVSLCYAHLSHGREEHPTHPMWLSAGIVQTKALLLALVVVAPTQSTHGMEPEERWLIHYWLQVPGWISVIVLFSQASIQVVDDQITVASFSFSIELDVQNMHRFLVMMMYITPQCSKDCSKNLACKSSIKYY